MYAKGDIFCATALRDSQRRVETLRYAMSFYETVLQCQPTETHEFIKTLHDQRKLLRCYTQNVDLLDSRVGLSTDLRESTVQCIPLHGTVHSLRCPACCQTYGWDGVFKEAIVAGEEPLCPGCAALRPRVGATRRASTMGRLRPNMVYLGEDHWQGEEIADLIDRDLSAVPDTLLILGTSLKVKGPGDLVKMFANTVRAKGGRVIYVNLSKPAQKWRKIFDYWVEWKCDRWVRDLKMRAPLFHGGRGMAATATDTTAYPVRAVPDQSPRGNSLDWRAALDHEDPNWVDTCELIKFGDLENRRWWFPFTYGDPDRLRFPTAQGILGKKKRDAERGRG
jgi:NAD-dependent SIR2 family protein deacetylase